MVFNLQKEQYLRYKTCLSLNTLHLTLKLKLFKLKQPFGSIVLMQNKTLEILTSHYQLMSLSEMPQICEICSFATESATKTRPILVTFLLGHLLIPSFLFVSSTKRTAYKKVILCVWDIDVQKGNIHPYFKGAENSEVNNSDQ